MTKTSEIHSYALSLHTVVSSFSSRVCCFIYLMLTLLSQGSGSGRTLRMNYCSGTPNAEFLLVCHKQLGGETHTGFCLK